MQNHFSAAISLVALVIALVALLVAWVAFTGQTSRIACANPTHVLRYE